MGEDKEYLEYITYAKFKINYEAGMRIYDVDENFTRLLGYTKSDIDETGITLMDIIPEEDWEEYTAMAGKTLYTCGEAYLGHRLKTKDDSVIYVFCYGKFFPAKRNGFTRVEILITDVTNTRMHTRQVVLAERDSLTGIYNHLTFKKKTEEAVERSDNLCAFFMLDIDDFKLVNDSIGHSAGDDMLRDTAGRLKQIMNEVSGIAGRLGGDEFAAFIPEISSEEKVFAIAERIKDELRDLPAPMAHTISVGFTIWDACDRPDFATMYSEADQALYMSKRNGKNQYRKYELNMLPVESGYTDRNAHSDFTTDILDNMGDVVYLADPVTYELIFLNKKAKQTLGLPVNDNSYKGKKCYKILQNLDEPCPFCTTSKLKPNRNYIWCHTNKVNGKKYILRDSIVLWNNKKCRMEIASEINSEQQIVNILTQRYDVEDLLAKCLKNIALGADYANRYVKVMEIIGLFFEAKHVSIIGLDRSERVYDWKSADTEDFGDDLDIFVRKLKETSDKEKQGIYDFDRNILVYNHRGYNSIDDKELLDFMNRHRIWSIYMAVINDSDGKMMGLMLIFNPQAHSNDIWVLEHISNYISVMYTNTRLLKAKDYELTHDIYTGLMNRASYMDYISGDRDYTSLGVLAMDINEQRTICDEFGQEYTNVVIKSFANKLQEIFPDGKLYRVGNDDFIVLCENIDRVSFDERTRKAARTFSEGAFTASVGYVWDNYDININRMEEHAYKLLYLNKQRRYENVKKGESSKWGALMRQLVHDNLKAGKYKVFFQPKLDYATGKFFGAEALVRLQEDGILKNPSRFVPALERSNTIKYIDLYVLEEVCKDMVRWREEGISIFPVSCNFSKLTLLEEKMAQSISEIVEHYNIPSEMIEIEITESIGEMEHEILATISNELHSRGFKLVMDDFGTKYSNVSVLSTMSFDTLKIDRSMIYNILENDVSRKVIKHIISMCRDIGVQCIAEGVESEAQAKLLSEYGCDLFQGFLYSRPVDAQEFMTLYMENMRDGLSDFCEA